MSRGYHRTFVEPTHLTSREVEVCRLLSLGQSTKEVAVSLDIAVKTAETHRANIMRKLGLHSVVQLVFWALRNNLVRLEEAA